VTSSRYIRPVASASRPSGSKPVARNLTWNTAPARWRRSPRDPFAHRVGHAGRPEHESHEAQVDAGTPASAMVGTFGIDGSRRGLATASIFSLGFSAWPARPAELII